MYLDLDEDWLRKEEFLLSQYQSPLLTLLTLLLKYFFFMMKWKAPYPPSPSPSRASSDTWYIIIKQDWLKAKFANTERKFFAFWKELGMLPVQQELILL